MAPPCDAACMKLIINTRLIAALAPALIARCTEHVSREAAFRLHSAASIHVGMIAALDFAASSDGFAGCEQAQTIVRWITNDAVEADLMDKWTAEIWSAIADLVAWKLPK